MIVDRVRRVFVLAFVLAFFAYLFGPLLIMAVSAFNSSGFPRVSPWECFTVEWFQVLANDEKLMNGLKNSVFIGIGVVLLAVPIGLAGALMLMQVGQRVRPVYYTVVISPILIPGVVLGISTLIFWDRLGTMFNAEYDSIFYNGIFLTILGQATFVSAYAMLVFISRLQRFDPALEEAALDLGATHVQSFRKVLLPFLKPAIGSAAVLAFLASFENYNTTVFTSLAEETLTTVLASKVRYGLNPSISALAVVIVAVTLFFAVVSEIVRRRQERMEKNAEAQAAGLARARAKQRPLAAEPAMIMLVLVFVAGLGTVYFAGTMGIDECKAAVAEEKKRRVEERIRELEQRRMFESGRPGAQPAPQQQRQAPAVRAPGTEGYQGIFAPGNLKGQADSEEPADAPAAPENAPGTEGYQNIFDPANLQGQAGAGGDAGGAAGSRPSGGEPADEPSSGSGGYQDIFDPANLSGQAGASDPVETGVSGTDSEQRGAGDDR